MAKKIEISDAVIALLSGFVAGLTVSYRDTLPLGYFLIHAIIGIVLCFIAIAVYNRLVAK